MRSSRERIDVDVAVQHQALAAACRREAARRTGTVPGSTSWSSDSNPSFSQMTVEEARAVAFLRGEARDSAERGRELQELAAVDLDRRGGASRESGERDGSGCRHGLEKPRLSTSGSPAISWRPCYTRRGRAGELDGHRRAPSRSRSRPGFDRRAAPRFDGRRRGPCPLQRSASARRNLGRNRSFMTSGSMPQPSSVTRT